MFGKVIEVVYKVATGSRRTQLLFAPLLGAFYLSLIAFFIFLSFVTDRSLNMPSAMCRPWSTIVGIGLIIPGLFLMLTSITYFVKVRGTPVPLSPPPALVCTGPYRFARNPMLSGIFIQLFGIGILSGSLSLVFIFTPLFIFINVLELKKVEEPELEKRLGQAYVDYKKRVPMFFPFRIRNLFR